MKVFSGDLELFESGVAQTAFVKAIKFDLEAFKFEINFKFDSDEKRHKFYLINNNKDLALDLFNYNTTEETGFIEPVEIGNLNGRVLWFNYMAKRVAANTDVWVLQYYFYYGEVLNE